MHAAALDADSCCACRGGVPGRRDNSRLRLHTGLPSPPSVWFAKAAVYKASLDFWGDNPWILVTGHFLPVAKYLRSPSPLCEALWRQKSCQLGQNQLIHPWSEPDSNTRGHGAVLFRVPDPNRSEARRSPGAAATVPSWRQAPRAASGGGCALSSAGFLRWEGEEGCARAELRQAPSCAVCSPQQPTVSSPDSGTRVTKPPSKLGRVRQEQILRARCPEACPCFSDISCQPFRELAFS